MASTAMPVCMVVHGWHTASAISRLYSTQSCASIRHYHLVTVCYNEACLVTFNGHMLSLQQQREQCPAVDSYVQHMSSIVEADSHTVDQRGNGC